MSYSLNTIILDPLSKEKPKSAVSALNDWIKPVFHKQPINPYFIFNTFS